MAVGSARRHDPLVQRYLALLLLFAAQNGWMLARAGTGGPLVPLLSCLAFALPALALLLRIAFSLSESRGNGRMATYAFYAPVAGLEGLLLGTKSLVAGAHSVQGVRVPVPGPWYPLLEVFVLLSVAALWWAVLQGALKGRSAHARLRARWWLIGVTPFGVLMSAVVVILGRHGVPSQAFRLIPAATSFFLLVSAYATYEYRLLDIEFYLPWSRVRRHKTAFHQRLRIMISEIADLTSVEEAVRRLAELLRCPVALVTQVPPAWVTAGPGMPLSDFPRAELRRIERTVVTREYDTPQTGLSTLLRQYHIAAVVPFHPYSRQAGGWLLLGDSFGEEIVTPLDFRLVERLFDGLADLFVDRQLALRATLDDALSEVAALKQELSVAHAALRDPPPPGIVFSGDPALFKSLRAVLPELTLRPAGPHVDVLISAALAHDPPGAELASDLLLSGPLVTHRAQPFAASPYLVDLLAQPVPEAIAHRTRTLLTLRAALFDDQDADEPLIGTSPAFRAVRAQARALPPDVPVWLQGTDRGQARAWARALHRPGPVVPAGTVGPADCAWFVEDDRPLPPGRVFLFAEHRALAAPLCAHTLSLPTLSERGEDVTLLVQYFAVRFRQRTGRPRALAEEECLDILALAPQSVAEVRAEVYARLGAEPRGLPIRECGSKSLREQVEAYEADLITQTLRRCAGNRAQAARLLGLKPNTLHYKLKRYGLH